MKIIIEIFIFLFLILSCSKYSSIKEIVIPEIYSSSAGIISKSGQRVRYLNVKNSKNLSDIKFDNNISFYQLVNRYMKVNGSINPLNIKLIGDYYRSVIFELLLLDSNNKVLSKEYYFIPIDNINKFTGFLYFKKRGKYKVFAYLFIDYNINNKMNIPNNINTTASLYFNVAVNEEVPEKLHFLLPTKNIDCGNIEIRKLASLITENCQSNLEKVRRIYEYIVFSDKNEKIRYKKYKKVDINHKEMNYHNTYIASQVLIKKQGICNDFAEVFAALTRASGLKVKKIWGFTNESKSIGHMWNLIDIEDDEKRWLRVDPTWGSLDKNNYKKWAEFYPEFNLEYFNNQFKPYNHNSFNYEQKIEY